MASRFKGTKIVKATGLVETLDFLRRNRRTAQPYRTRFLGREFIVLPGVLSPEYFDDSRFFGTHLPRIVGRKRLCEVGVGTGVLSVLCALGGAQVSGVDINPQAVENTRQNIGLHKCNIDVRVGDLLAPFIGNKFDFIFWNHPFYWTSREPKDELEMAVVDKKI